MARVLEPGGKHLEELAARAARAAVEAGIELPDAGRPFAPHVTLARVREGRRGARPEVPERFYQLDFGLGWQPSAAAWVESPGGGAPYRVLAELPLSMGPPDRDRAGGPAAEKKPASGLGTGPAIPTIETLTEPEWGRAPREPRAPPQTGRTTMTRDTSKQTPADNSVRDKALTAALGEIEKSYGKGAIMRLGDALPGAGDARHLHRLALGSTWRSAARASPAGGSSRSSARSPRARRR